MKRIKVKAPEISTKVPVYEMDRQATKFLNWSLAISGVVLILAAWVAFR